MELIIDYPPRDEVYNSLGFNLFVCIGFAQSHYKNYVFIWEMTQELRNAVTYIATHEIFKSNT